MNTQHDICPYKEPRSNKQCIYPAYTFTIFEMVNGNPKGKAIRKITCCASHAQNFQEQQTKLDRTIDNLLKGK